MIHFVEILHNENGETQKINVNWGAICTFYETEDGGKIELKNGRVLTVSKSFYMRFYEQMHMNIDRYVSVHGA